MSIFNKNNYSQNELKEIFLKKMSDEEVKKLAELNLDKEIEKIKKPNFKIKYINKVGYVFIREGYLIMNDGTEPIHYFAKIYNTEEKAKNEIISEYNEISIKEAETIDGQIRKTMLDENGMEYEVEEKIKIPSTEQIVKEFKLETLIKENAGPDPFWKDCIKEFFNKVDKTLDEKIEFVKKISLDQNLFNEFTKEIVKKLDANQIFEKYNKLINNKK